MTIKVLRASKKKVISKFRKLIADTSFWKGFSIILLAILVLTQVFEISITPKWLDTRIVAEPDNIDIDIDSISKVVLPEEGVTLPVAWGDFGKQMISDGVIDEAKFRALFEGGLTTNEEQMLTGNMDSPIVLNEKNSRYLLDLLWAFGLANKNDILDNGEMTDEQYDGAGNFASTGGWSLAKGAGIDHYSMHSYIVLDAKQQALVDKVSLGIFRPCCGNSTHFPDCNHGMAMLGLLELMAKNGATEIEMYSVALKVNSFWFPQTYIDLATYFEEQGTDWASVDPELALSAEYSSAQGYQQTKQLIESLPKPELGGGGCGA
ncbi:hypothetical protein COW99_00955 [Candidatus Roizmanbacteria bacterium CG22_combo_CG10-13_8_21_14_all_38_20]|uniref:Uncharacterized protein n=1 Tax=Candidatus Roizmanbacteria bacterium CG22_combo_CG10-13_8_21_14_all_38_20 TaxID=1974862 RepID=A0A2H0BWH3_9BACT|nr:hypothetical protein [Candidatus Microgenomates bacterium]PIP62033.1 MAG: hypothetical protein COW99_00955 [Candidatus Roizmanbacteria bacterium CG22_combo_CG10-13_8_21_14_all_38_20]PJC31674.1 MAG: hypothetical protein CO050_02585 [Candidatus Roizmanbacteria bacterium CG_4_9_14_0_2_um_filter_38_17]